MTDEDDALWLGSVREALEDEALSSSEPRVTADPAVREAIAKKALEAYAPPKRASVVRLAWALPAVAMAAALLLFLRRPSEEGAFIAYHVEVTGVATTRGPEPAAPARLTVAPGVPFGVVLRPAASADDPVHHAYVFVRSKAGVRAVDASAEVAVSGAVRVTGDGAALGDADELIVVLTRREARPDVWLPALTPRADAEYTLSAESDRPAARVFVVPVVR
jgi:hypothetical protein